MTFDCLQELLGKGSNRGSVPALSGARSAKANVSAEGGVGQRHHVDVLTYRDISGQGRVVRDVQSFS